MKLLLRLFESWPIFRRFWPDVRPHAWRLVWILCLSALVVGLQLAQPWPIQWVFDNVLVPSGTTQANPARGVILAAAAMIAIIALHAGIEMVVNVQTAQVGHAVARSLRLRTFRHLGRLSPRFHSANKSGDLLVRLVGDVSMLKSMLVESATDLITRALWVAGTIGVMLYVNWRLSLTLFLILPLVLVVVRALSARIRTATRKARRKEGDMADFLHEMIAATDLVQSLGREDAIARRFARSNRTSERAGLKAARLAARMGASVHSLLGVGVAATLLLGALAVLKDPQAFKPGELLVFLAYVRGLLKPVRSASRNSERIARGAASGERVLEILDAPIEIADRANARPAPAQPQCLEFDSVTFRYDDERDALQEFSARFERGLLTGLFGKSGAGKSTVTALAVRLQDPQAGAIRLDGVDLRDLQLDSLRARFGVCLQRSVLFGDSLRENLLLGDPNASDQALWQALEDAGAADFVRLLPAGLDTVLGSSGVGTSGGQARRLALARTLLRRAPVIVVDEPFSGLDREASMKVRQTLRECAKDAIVIVIAHELDCLPMYDHVIFVDEGRVQGEGTHASLSSDNAKYRSTLEHALESAL